MLAWVARFRFVTVEVLAERFGVSVRRANSRVSALTAAGMLECRQDVRGQRRAVFISRRGAAELGLATRRPPRPEIQRTHELAIVRLAAQIEVADPDAVLLTERECRLIERETGRACSVEVIDRHGQRGHRWPDLVIDEPGNRVAIEIEIAAKTTDRLRRIVSAYADGGVFDEARLLVATAPLGLRIERLCRAATRYSDLLALESTRLVVASWPGAPADERMRIDAALAGVQAIG